MSHLISILILLRKMKTSNVKLPVACSPNPNANLEPQSASGISFKSQALYLIVYTTRYLGGHLSCATKQEHWLIVIRVDLFWTFTSSAYLTIFKVLFIASSAYTVYLMLNDYKPTHDPNIDTFKVQYLLGGSAVLAVLFPYKYKVTEAGVQSIMWSRPPTDTV